MKKIIAFGATILLGILSLIFVTDPAQAAVPPPHNLVLSQITSTSAYAKWQTVTGAEAYSVYANGVRKGPGTAAGTAKIMGLAPCTKYYIQISVRVGGVWSPKATGSGSKTMTTTGCGTVTPVTTTVTTAAEKYGWGTPVAAGSDEFNGTGVDESKWNNYTAIAGHAGNGRRMASQSIVSGGVLTQTGLSNGDTGYLSSKYRPGTMYGKWEVRMRTSARDSEYHPVVLLWPDTGGDSTTDDEVDFAEGGDDTTTMKFYLHYGTPGQHLQVSASRVIDTREWHNYAVEWSASGVKGYIDGELWFSDGSASHNPNQPMHQAIQLDWFPDGTVTRESWMQVDWTRTYA